MSQLTKEQDEALKKCSTDRLRSRLINAGEDAEKVNSMDRFQLLEAVTSVMLSDGDTAQAKAPITDDLQKLDDWSSQLRKPKNVWSSRQWKGIKSGNKDVLNYRRRRDDNRGSRSMRLKVRTT